MVDAPRNVRLILQGLISYFPKKKKAFRFEMSISALRLTVHEAVFTPARAVIEDHEAKGKSTADVTAI